MFAILRQRNFALLWFGQLVSLTGDWVLIITLPFYVYQLTGSTLATGAMFIVQMLPRVLFGSLAGVFVDRWNRKWTMIMADLLRANILLLLLLIHSRDLLWLVYTVGTLETTISLFFTPARTALVPNIVDKEHLVAANSLDSVADNLTRLIGPSIGGALLGLLGTITGVALIDSLSYLISGLLIMLIIVPPVQKETQVVTEHAPEAQTFKATLVEVWKEWLDGLRIVKNEQIIRAIFIVMGLTVLADSPITALIVPLVKDILHGGAAALGWLMTLRGLGGLLGGFITERLNKTVRVKYLIMVGLVIDGFALLAVVNFPNLSFALLLMAVAGIAAMFWIINAVTMLQSNVADAYRGRVFGAYDTTASLLAVASMTVASTLGDHIGAAPILNAAGILYVLAGLSAILMLKGIRKQVHIEIKEPEAVGAGE